MTSQHQEPLVDATLERLVSGQGAMNAHMEHVRADMTSLKSAVSGIKDDVTILKERDAARDRRVLGIGALAGGGSGVTMMAVAEWIMRHVRFP